MALALNCGHECPRITKGLCYKCYKKMLRARDPEAARIKEAAYRKANREAIQRNNRKAESKRGANAPYPKTLYKFDITKEEYKQMLEAQKGLCVICEQQWSRRLCIDHNHTTGKVRALLCGPCNAGIGMLQDSAAIVYKAAVYLTQFNGVIA